MGSILDFKSKKSLDDIDLGKYYDSSDKQIIYLDFDGENTFYNNAVLDLHLAIAPQRAFPYSLSTVCSDRKWQKANSLNCRISGCPPVRCGWFPDRTKAFPLNWAER